MPAYTKPCAGEASLPAGTEIAINKHAGAQIRNGFALQNKAVPAPAAAPARAGNCASRSKNGWCT